MRGVSLQGKSLNFPLLLDTTPTEKLSPPVPWSQTTYWKNILVFLIAFRQILSKILPEECIYSNTIMTYLKKLVGTKSINTKKYPVELSPINIPYYPRKHLWETLGIGKNPTQQPKIYSFPPPEKSPLLNLLLLLSKVSFLPHQIVIFI